MLTQYHEGVITCTGCTWYNTDLPSYCVYQTLLIFQISPTSISILSLLTRPLILVIAAKSKDFKQPLTTIYYCYFFISISVFTQFGHL